MCCVHVICPALFTAVLTAVPGGPSGPSRPPCHSRSRCFASMKVGQHGSHSLPPLVPPRGGRLPRILPKWRAARRTLFEIAVRAPRREADVGEGFLRRPPLPLPRRHHPGGLRLLRLLLRLLPPLLGQGPVLGYEPGEQSIVTVIVISPLNLLPLLAPTLAIRARAGRRTARGGRRCHGTVVISSLLHDPPALLHSPQSTPRSLGAFRERENGLPLE